MSSCKSKSTLEEKEVEILRDAIDIAEKRKGKRVVSDPDVKKIISILEDFLKEKSWYAMVERLLIIFFL